MRAGRPSARRADLPASPPPVPRPKRIYNRVGAGAILLARIDAWCRATGTAEGRLGAILFDHPGYVALLRKRLTVSVEKEAAVTAFLAAFPDGVDGREADLRRWQGGARHFIESAGAVPPNRAPAEAVAEPPRTAAADPCLVPAEVAKARRDVVAEIEAEAAAATARRRSARRLTTRHPLHAQGAIEVVQSACVETPHDLIRAVNARYPGLWRRCCALGRALGRTPAATLYDALERGLTAMEDADAHED